MFDPFGDYETRGYLRNVDSIKELDELKYIEHGFFESNLEPALAHLHAIKGSITYVHFLEVHRILFGEFYPWAGQDRHALGVGRLVGKGQRIQFEASELCQRAVEWALSAGNNPKAMREKPGMVMGAFAWGILFWTGTVVPCFSSMRSFATAQVSPLTGMRPGKTITWNRLPGNWKIRKASTLTRISYH